MEVAGVASQWQQQAVAGAPAVAPSLMGSAQCSVLLGRAVLLHSKFGAPLQGGRRPEKEAGGLVIVAMGGKKKVNAYDDAWSKKWFGAGFFAENIELEEVDIIKKLEKKKLLSQVEKAGLLSKAESAGLSLSAIEKLGLLSKAENLGLLTLAENFATASPAVLASLSLPLFVASIATVTLIPDTSSALVIGQNVLAAFFLASSVGLFVGSIILTGLQEE